jgi:hypothetical protein
MMKRIVDVRALVQKGADQGADYPAKPNELWINTPVIGMPMGKYPADRETQRSFGMDRGSIVGQSVSDAPVLGMTLNPAVKWTHPFRP